MCHLPGLAFLQVCDASHVDQEHILISRNRFTLTRTAVLAK